jgi:RNA polymerase sigma-70 factor, ECF subfamily
LDRGASDSIAGEDLSQDSLYQQAADTCGSSLDRLARAYELDPDARRDLLQDIHLQIWRSLAHFDGRCSLRTWVYRVAHNTASGHVLRQRRMRSRLVSIESIKDIDNWPNNDQVDISIWRDEALHHLFMLIQRLKPLDRQIIISYLEGMEASSIGDITGLSPENIAMKVHRIKDILRCWSGEGGLNAQ